MNLNANFMHELAIWAIPVLLAITVHEAGHGLAAYWRGDQTAKLLGRLTLNPIKHIDPIGTIAVPAILLLMGGFLFGWAKPVPINSRYLKRPRLDMSIIAFAGPATNFLMAISWVYLGKLSQLLLQQGYAQAQGLLLMAIAGVRINILLAVLNLLPLPPLDGGRILRACLPYPADHWLDRIEPYGFFILIALLTTGILAQIMTPLIALCYQALSI